MDEENDTQKARAVSADVLCEFLEAAFHLILYIREVYPPAIFERRKKYNVPVQMSCHPELNSYIQDVLQTIKPLIEKGEVQKISLVISDKEYHPIERFSFEIGCSTLSLSSDNLLLNTESALRGFLLKISVCDALLKANPPDCTFSVLVHTKESSYLELQNQPAHCQEFPWISADKEMTSMRHATIIPLKSMASPLLQMQLFVEESDLKP
ncbi:mitotic spindle assembly checkpoint protein MAD2B isoform X2 [Nematostella vectensis]|uniref:mitotic spindle assembly checkpoint protein MAD2B isoform X2 n=1 Tax=Nematostella vectensis TaxID=45351 RepID=UPI0020772BBE|nr:mitotic spindle assembly checkpoint protein MAD2B isoform X2 [Nematostella vectensis]XP_048589572.1 mitotic spindle assembly checkpoint protein MAD2B isoform X2 [Nematostella vectensis]XP_048589573.1 mitotic spindle assembly checkpoint protein MAD2B isoform X2 [Nematostella vectensis]